MNSLASPSDVSSSLSSNNDNRPSNSLTRRNTSSASAAQKRTGGADSHSDSDSQFDSAMESHPNSDSESDPDLESPGQDKNVATLPHDIRRLCVQPQSSHQPSLTATERTQSMTIGREHGHRHADQDLGMDLDQDLYGLSALAAAARQMPRREPLPQRTSSSVHDDSNASESEGSLALEGIDSARQWPSMSDEPLSFKPKHKMFGQLMSERSQREDAQYSPKQQSDHFGRGATTTTTASNLSIARTSRVKDSITKDSVPRKWICRQVPVKTLGGEMIMPIWFSEEDMLLNEPVAPIELDNDRMDMDLMGAHLHSDHHHQQVSTDDLHAHSARQKRKMKLKDMALRESRDPQDLIDLPEPMDNKRRHNDSHAKELKARYHYKEYSAGEKRFKVHNENKKEWTYKAPQDKTEFHASTRDSTPTTLVDTMPESNISSPSAGARPRPFICNIEDCGKRFVDALQLERHIERHGPKELECDLDVCGKLFSSLMLLRRHQSMVHKRRSEKWESPASTSKPRTGRSRRKEPRIVASGDVMDPSELERQPRGSVEIEQSAEDDGDDGDDDIDENEASRPLFKKELGGSKGPNVSKSPRELKSPKTKSHTPKRLAPKSDEHGSSGSDIYSNADTKGESQSSRAQRGSEDGSKAGASASSRPRPFHCTYDDCKKVFIDQIQLDRHLERHGPKELECGIEGCRKRFSAQMLLRRHQSMVHKRRSPAVPVNASTGMRYHKAALAAVAAGPLSPASSRPSVAQESPAPPSTSYSSPSPPASRQF
ncbi:hypothetical protein BGX31_003478 [Mortierella sp. GBA43]|nr:hypothetical protein BGX31_003478 [Mortierella sp. GBA43]